MFTIFEEVLKCIVLSVLPKSTEVLRTSLVTSGGWHAVPAKLSPVDILRNFTAPKRDTGYTEPPVSGAAAGCQEVVDSTLIAIEDNRAEIHPDQSSKVKLRSGL